jgi:CHAT domain-containing protein
VVLNGCQTGVRDWRAVDEGMGLMSAFLVRGAALILATQWRVHDYCAAEIVTSFLTEFLRNNVPPTAALRRAVRRARALSADEIERRCTEALRLFRPERMYPHEVARIHKQAALAALWSGKESLVRQHGPQAVRALRDVEAVEETEELEGALAGGTPRADPSRSNRYEDPVYWAAFQLIGRVT